MTQKFSVIILLLFLATACGTAQLDSDQDTGSDLSEQDDQMQELKRTIDGIEYYLSVNQATYTLDEVIKVTANVKNVSDQPINYIGFDGCDDGLHTFVSVPELESRLQVKNNGEEMIGCTDAIENHTLAPGDTLIEETQFVPKIRMGSEQEVDVPTGDYPVELVFQRGSMEANDHREPKIELVIRIDGEEALLTKEEAEAIAQDNDELKSWLSTRVGSAVTKEEDGTYYVMIMGAWQKAAKDVYDEMQDYQPETHIQFEDNKWKISYLDKQQGPPHQIEVIVDAKNSEVNSVEKHTK